MRHRNAERSCSASGCRSSAQRPSRGQRFCRHQPLPSRGDRKAAVVGRERRGLFARSSDTQPGCKMHGIHTAQAMALREITRNGGELRVEIDDSEAPPEAVEQPPDPCRLSSGRSALPSDPTEECAAFDVRDPSDGGEIRFVDAVLDLLSSGLDHEQLHDRARIEKEDQSRSSRTISAALGPRPRSRSGFRGTIGLPAGQVSLPSRRSSARPGARPAGTILAMGSPRSVTSNASPRRTRRR